MANLLLRLLLTPSLICLASLAGRRWGPLVSGWLVGLPFTSGPVTLVLALGHGESFATAAALGTLAGTLSQVGFCLGYARLAPHGRWPLALGAGTLVFALATLVLQQVSLPALPLFLLTCAALGVGLMLLAPKAKSSVTVPARPDATLPTTTAAWPWWDLPLRMVLATSVVLVLTSVATRLGAHLTGLLAPFPVYATILASFAHRTQGADAARAVLRGLLLGLFAFSSFFVSLALLLTSVGVVGAFVVACAAALLVQAGTLWVAQGTRVGSNVASGRTR